MMQNRGVNMKKLFILIVLMCLACPFFAEGTKKGLNVNAGVTGSYMTFFTYENIAFRQATDNKMGFGYEVGLRLMENYMFDPYLYYAPYVQFTTNWFYIGLGYFWTISFQNDETEALYFRTGATVLPFELGGGEARIDIGIELSPTVYFDPYCKYPGSSILDDTKARRANRTKLSVGLNWFLPL